MLFNSQLNTISF